MSVGSSFRRREWVILAAYAQGSALCKFQRSPGGHSPMSCSLMRKCSYRVAVASEAELELKFYSRQKEREREESLS